MIMKRNLLFSFSLLLSLFFVSCEREISFENGGVPGVVTGGGSAGGSAQYDFDGGTSTCTGATLAGTFTAGTPTTAANTVTLQVTVDSIGTWTVATSTINGVSFSGSGTFTTTGAQTITLNATGTPINAGPYNFTPGAGNCAFTVTVAPAVVNVTGNFKAKIDGTQWVADRIAQGARMNGIINLTGLGIDRKVIAMTIMDSGVHQYTLYYDNTSLNVGAYTDSNSASSIAFSTNAGSTPGETGGFLNITSIDEANKKMSGTFGFKAKRLVDNTYRDITEGSFTNISYITTLAPGNATDTFTSKVDGVTFTPSAVNGTIITLPNNSIAINGSDATGVRTVAIYFPTDIITGTYNIGSLGDLYYGQYNATASNFLMSSSGTLEILFHDPVAKRVRGRFSFAASELIGTQTAQITEGYFAVTYQ
jgi:hypothetical protein